MTNNQDRPDPSGTRGPRGSSNPEAQCFLNADHMRALAHDQEDESMVYQDEGLILTSDRVSAACNAGGITQTRQVTSSLAGIAQRNGQTLVSAIAANPQAGASGVAYYLTVPRVRRLASGIEHQQKVRRHRACSKRLGRTPSKDPWHSFLRHHRPQGHDTFSMDPTTRTLRGTLRTTRSPSEERSACSRYWTLATR